MSIDNTTYRFTPENITIYTCFPSYRHRRHEFLSCMVNFTFSISNCCNFSYPEQLSECFKNQIESLFSSTKWTATDCVLRWLKLSVICTDSLGYFFRLDLICLFVGLHFTSRIFKMWQSEENRSIRQFISPSNITSVNGK